MLKKSLIFTATYNEFPNIKPCLDNYDFPRKIFTDKYLKKVLNKDRLEKIRKSIQSFDYPDSNELMITYKYDWEEADHLVKYYGAIRPYSPLELHPLDWVLTDRVMEFQYCNRGR